MSNNTKYIYNFNQRQRSFCFVGMHGLWKVQKNKKRIKKIIDYITKNSNLNIIGCKLSQIISIENFSFEEYKNYIFNGNDIYFFGKGFIFHCNFHDRYFGKYLARINQGCSLRIIDNNILKDFEILDFMKYLSIIFDIHKGHLVIDDLETISIYGRWYSNLIGHKYLLKAPAFNVEKLDKSIFFLQHSKDFLDYNSFFKKLSLKRFHWYISKKIPSEEKLRELENAKLLDLGVNY
ncbi:MAG: hypothetical protein ACOC1K_02885 [Nanoarchaeota archaeon]